VKGCESMPELNSDKDLERALRELAPAPSGLDRDRLMYRAGQIAAPRTSLLWPASTVVLGAAVVLLAVLLVAGWESRQFAQHIPVPGSTPMPPRPIDKATLPPSRPVESEAIPVFTDDEAQTSDFVHFRMQDQVMRWGLDAVPAPPPDTGPEAHIPPITVERSADSAAGKSSSVLGIFRFFQ
jgi:hypothetical protein